ncbi:hypothetical protein Dimus_018337, partial [Dionaea muscipula]
MSRRLEEKERFIEGFGREFATLKTSYKSLLKNALDRAEAVEAKEKLALEVSKLNANKLRATQEKLQKAVDEEVTYKGRYAAVDGILEEKNEEISRLKNELISVKGDNNELYRRNAEAKDVMEKAEADFAT